MLKMVKSLESFKENYYHDFDLVIELLRDFDNENELLEVVKTLVFTYISDYDDEFKEFNDLIVGVYDLDPDPEYHYWIEKAGNLDWRPEILKVYNSYKECYNKDGFDVDGDDNVIWDEIKEHLTNNLYNELVLQNESWMNELVLEAVEQHYQWHNDN